VKAVQKNFLPLDDESRFDVSIRAPEGMSLAQTQLVAERMAREIRQIPGVQLTVATVGSPPGDPSGRGPNQASLFVRLVPANRRADDQQASWAACAPRCCRASPRAPPRLRVAGQRLRRRLGRRARRSSTCSRALTSSASGTYSQQLLERVRASPASSTPTPPW
jgi:multidrug efflux pump subunit AcrB